MIDNLARTKYVYCRRRVEFLTNQEPTEETLLAEAFDEVYANCPPAVQQRVAQTAEHTMRTIEQNMKAE